MDLALAVELISPELAETLCRAITADLPEYFGLPECNEHYAKGVRSRTNFAAKFEDAYVGILSLDFPYPENGNIYWMGVARSHHSKGIGTALLAKAAEHVKSQGGKTISVETLSPAESDENYLKTYRFYETRGFLPLFDLKPVGYTFTMVYMCKVL